jgi:hypothetical protein
MAGYFRQTDSAKARHPAGLLYFVDGAPPANGDIVGKLPGASGIGGG